MRRSRRMAPYTAVRRLRRMRRRIRDLCGGPALVRRPHSADSVSPLWCSEPLMRIHLRDPDPASCPVSTVMPTTRRLGASRRIWPDNYEAVFGQLAKRRSASA